MREFIETGPYYRSMLPFAVLMMAATPPSPLVTPEWLAGHLNDSSIVILHVGGPEDYQGAHLPGARLVRLSDISVPGPRDIRLELPPVEDLRQAFGKLGVSDQSHIVVYAGTDSVQSATRVWFTLDYLGLGARTSLLDGGLAWWRKQGRPVTQEVPQVQPQTFTVHPRPEIVAQAEWLRDHLKDSAFDLLDARLPQFYSGAEPGMASRAGHIPGARNVPFDSLLDADRRFLPPETLKQKLAVRQSVVSYCHIGQQATVIYFVARWLGLDARMYDGSFRDWTGREGYPVEKSAP